MAVAPPSTNASNAAANAAAAQSTSEAASARLSGNFDTFLKMLTTQLKYQDPLNPTDTADFTNQLVMYSQVEQQINGNKKLDDLIALQKGSSIQSALGYLGYYVESSKADLPLQNGTSFFNITLEKDAKIKVSIYDSENQLVKSFSDDGKKGPQTYSWNGINGQDLPVEDGTYKIVAVATDPSGKTVKSTVTAYGLVTGIDLDKDGNSVLKAGNVSIYPDEVKSIRGATAADNGGGGDDEGDDEGGDDTTT